MGVPFGLDETKPIKAYETIFHFSGGLCCGGNGAGANYYYSHVSKFHISKFQPEFRHVEFEWKHRVGDAFGESFSFSFHQRGNCSRAGNAWEFSFDRSGYAPGHCGNSGNFAVDRAGVVAGIWGHVVGRI